jgi:trehalose-phosphatase
MDSVVDTESDYWLKLARHSPLGIVSDLDGTLLPFAATPDEARPTPAIRELLAAMAALRGVTLIIASGRPQETLEEFFPLPRDFLLVAEHGAWRSSGQGWESTLSLDREAIASLAWRLSDLRQKYPAALLERKTWSLALHSRGVPTQDKRPFLVQASAVIDPWLRAHPDFELLSGNEVIEVRPRAARKATAITWARTLMGPTCRLVVVGDDTTDEDMFVAASSEDATILVGADPRRTSAARWRLGSPREVHAFYRRIISIRREGTHGPR